MSGSCKLAAFSWLFWSIDLCLWRNSGNFQELFQSLKYHLPGDSLESTTSKMNPLLAPLIPVLLSLPSILQLSANWETRKYICHQWVAKQRNNSHWLDGHKCLCGKGGKAHGGRKSERKDFAWIWRKDKPRSIKKQNRIHPIARMNSVRSASKYSAAGNRERKLQVSVFVLYFRNNHDQLLNSWSTRWKNVVSFFRESTFSWREGSRKMNDGPLLIYNDGSSLSVITLVLGWSECLWLWKIKPLKIL